MAAMNRMLVLLLLFYLTFSCHGQNLVDPGNIFRETNYKCPTELNTSTSAPEVSDHARLCLMSNSTGKTFKEAQQACRDRKAYLINHDLPSVDQLILNSSHSGAKNQIYLSLRNAEYWTGLHYDGQGLFWDGDLPSSPDLNIQCGNGSLISEKGSAWFCDDLEQWENPGTDICVAAKYNYLTDEKVKLVLRNCSEKKGWICAGYSSIETFAFVEGSLHCEPGWLWNAYTDLCIKIVNNTGPTTDACIGSSTAGSAELFSFYRAVEEVQPLLQNLFMHPSSQAYQGVTVRVGPWPVEVAYVDGKIYQRFQNGDAVNQILPCICEVKGQPITEEGSLPVELAVDNSQGHSTLQCLVNSTILDSSVPHAFFTPNGEIRKEVSIDSPLLYDQGGDYKCVVYNSDTANYSYSPAVHLNQSGALYYATVQFLLDELIYEPWQSMVRYYPEMNSKSTSPFTLHDVLSNMTFILEKSFETSVVEITQDADCSYCTGLSLNADSQMNVLRLTDTRPSNGSVLVTTAVVYYTSDDMSDRSLSEKQWDFVIAHMRRNLASSLSSKALDSLRFFNSKGRELGAGWDKNQLAQPKEPCGETKINIKTLDETVTFPAAPDGDTYSTKSLCPGSATQPLAKGTCVNGIWNLTNICVIENTTETTKTLLQISLGTENIEDSTAAIAALEKTVNISSEELDAAEVSLVTNILVNSAQTTIENEAVLNETFTLIFANIDNLLDTEDEAFNEAQNTSNTSERIISVLDDLIHKPLPLGVLNQTGGDVFEVTKPNIAFKLSTDDSLIGITSLTEEIASDSIDYVTSDGLQGMQGELPLAALRLEGLGEQGQGKRRAFVAYKDDKLHRSARTGETSAGRILSATIADLNGSTVELKGIPGLVRVLYPQGAQDTNSTELELACGYWKTNTSEWSTDGCSLTERNETEIECICDHLTDFSVFFQTRVLTSPVDPVYQDALEAVTMVGLVTSNVCLIFVIITFILSKKLRRKTRQRVLVCLSISILGLNMSFLIGSRLTNYKIACTILSACTHYFLLSVFAWTCVDGVLLYTTCGGALKSAVEKPSHFMRKASIPAVLGPALIVAVTFITSAIANDNYYFTGRTDICWLKMDVIYYAVFIPVGAVLVANIAILVRVLLVIISSRNMTGRSVNKKSAAVFYLKTTVTMFLILGLTWVFGFLTLIEDALEVFQFLFCIFNAFQGVFIFVLHHMRSPIVHNAWTQLMKKSRRRQGYSFGQERSSKGYGKNVSGKLFSKSDVSRTDSNDITDNSNATDTFLLSSSSKNS